MNARVGPYRVVVMWCCLLLLGGCASTEPARFYVLKALPSSSRLEMRSGDAANLAVGVGPVELPQYLDRPQIASRSGSYELQFAEFDQWAEPLKNSVTRILSENLSHLLGTDHIASHPWPRTAEFAYQVIIQLTHFEGTMGEDGGLTARWAIVNVEEQRELLRKTSRYEVAIEGANYPGMVSALSQALGELSQEIAVALRELSRT